MPRSLRSLDSQLCLQEVLEAQRMLPGCLESKPQIQVIPEEVMNICRSQYLVPAKIAIAGMIEKVETGSCAQY